MKHHTHRLLTAIVLALAATCVWGQTTIGYTNGNVDKNKKFRVTTNTDQRLAIRLSKEKLQEIKGQTISAVNVAVCSRNSTDGKMTLFLADALDATPLRQQEVTIAGINKLVAYTLDQPYTITGNEEALYVGYTMQIPSNYGPMSGDGSRSMPGTAYAYGQNGWEDIASRGYGSPNIEIVLSNSVNINDVVLKPFQKEGCYHVGDELDLSLEVFNFGTETITSLDLSISVGDEPTVTKHFDDVAIAPHATSTLSVEGITSNQEGQHDLGVIVDQVNGRADDDYSDNKQSTSLCFYPTDITKRVLVENFTSQTCSNCPSGHEALAAGIAEAGIDVVQIAHHSGFTTDIFTMKEDWTLANLFGGSTYAPAMMVDRNAFGGTTPVSEISKAHTIDAIQKASHEKPYVRIDLEAAYDPDTRQVSATADVFTYETLPSTDMRYSLWLVQDGVVARQLNGGDNYIHDHISRGVITEGTWGEKADFVAGETLHKEFSFTLGESITSTSYEKTDGKNVIPSDASKMSLVFIVSEMSSNDVTACRVFNCQETPLMGSGETLVASPSVSFAPQGIYTLSGQKVAKAGRGIYIIEGKKVVK